MCYNKNMSNKRKKVILKNTSKYEVLKLAKGVDLGQYLHYSANYNVENNYKYISDWVYTDDGRVYFKSGESVVYGDTQRLRVVNELLYDNLAMQLGMWTAKYEPATLKDTSSLISHDVLEFADMNEELRTIGNYFNVPFRQEIGLDRILEKWDSIPQLQGYKCDKEDLVFKIYRMMVLDAITFQEDRHEDNIHLFVDDKNKTVRFAPIIDNEYAFAAKTLNKFFEVSEYGNLEYIIDEDEFLAQHGAALRLTVRNDTQYLPSPEKYKKNAMDLVKFASTKPRLKAFLFDALKCVDINQAIESIERKGYAISDDYKQYLKDLTKLSKKIFAECIKEYKETNEQAKREGDCKE